MTTANLILETVSGAQVVAYNVVPDSQCDTLTKARRMFFNRKGTVNFTERTAEHNGSRLFFKK